MIKTPLLFLPVLLSLIFIPLSPLSARDAVSGKEVTGTFQNKTGSQFEIKALGQGKLRVNFSGIYPYKVQGQLTANTGEASGIATIQADTAVFKPKDFEKTCTIVLYFSKLGEVQVTQHGDDSDCGFGHNVNASGNYKKISK